MAKGGKRPGAGRPPGKTSASTAAIRSLAKDLSIEALSIVLATMRDENLNAGLRLQAANIILERGHGRPSTEIPVIDTDPEVMDKLIAGEITALNAALELEKSGYGLPATVGMLMKAELRHVAPPEEEIKLPPDDGLKMCHEEYVEFFAWKGAKARAARDEMVARIVAEQQA